MGTYQKFLMELFTLNSNRSEQPRITVTIDSRDKFHFLQAVTLAQTTFAMPFSLALLDEADDSTKLRKYRISFSNTTQLRRNVQENPPTASKSIKEGGDPSITSTENQFASDAVMVAVATPAIVTEDVRAASTISEKETTLTATSSNL